MKGCLNWHKFSETHLRIETFQNTTTWSSLTDIIDSREIFLNCNWHQRRVYFLNSPWDSWLVTKSLILMFQSYCRDDLRLCLAGRCESVGCDLKLRSGMTLDRCGVCGGAGASCADMFSWTLTPLSPCSVTCGGGDLVMGPQCVETRRVHQQTSW